MIVIVVAILTFGLGGCESWKKRDVEFAAQIRKEIQVGMPLLEAEMILKKHRLERCRDEFQIPRVQADGVTGASTRTCTKNGYTHLIIGSITYWVRIEFATNKVVRAVEAQVMTNDL